MFEHKEQITFIEFRTWLSGLIKQKHGALPDLDDWKQIKVMLDIVDVNISRQCEPTLNYQQSQHINYNIAPVLLSHLDIIPDSIKLSVFE